MNSVRCGLYVRVQILCVCVFGMRLFVIIVVRQEVNMLRLVEQECMEAKKLWKTVTIDKDKSSPSFRNKYIDLRALGEIMSSDRKHEKMKLKEK